MKDLILDLIDYILYDLLKRPLPETLPFTLEHQFLLVKEKGGFWVKSKEYPGLVASGDTLEELREALFDSILTYFDVPRAVAKRSVDTLILRLSDGRVIKPKAIPIITANLATA